MQNRNLRAKFKAAVIAAALAALPTGAGAAGLGKITVLSALGQPLRAEVDLSATRDELSGLRAQLATADAFRQAGIEYAPTLASIRVAVDKRPNGQPYLRLTSNRPINDPFLDLLLEVSWSQGRLQREYTFLLDPAPDAITPRAAAVVPPQARAETPAVSKPVAPQAEPEVRPAAPLQDRAAAGNKAAGARAATAPAVKTAAAGDREVKKGDTLAKIAAETRHEGVSLDQMLVALFNGNRGAFAGGNMNRLRAGQILNIPDREAVAAVAPEEAHRVVMAQASDFNAYRKKLAVAAAATEATEEAPRQTASGKITAKIEDKAPAPAAAQDQLKVSRADAARDTKALQGKVASLEEETVAKDKALKEANSRLAELEKNVRDLQKLIELKNQNLAELQKQAGAAQAPVAKPEAVPPVAAVPPSAQMPSADKPAKAPAKPLEAAPAAPDKPVETPAAAAAPPPQARPPAPAAEPKKPAAVKRPAPAPMPEPSFFDELTDNPLILAGGAGILALLGLLGVRQYQRRKLEAEPLPTTTSVSIATNSVFGSTGGQSVDTSSASSMQSDFSQASISAIDADEGVDPVAEADVYMAYGRDAQAEEILLDALKNDSSRTAIHVKLLEIYASRKNVKKFETLASELYAQTGGVGADWEKAAALGLQLDPNNPLYGGRAPGESAAATHGPAVDATIVVSSPEKLKDTWTMPGELEQISQAVEHQGGTSTVVLDKETLSAAQAQPLEPLSLDFDLDLGTPPAPEKETPAASAVHEPLPLVDFELGTAPQPAAAPAVAEAPLDLDFKLPDAGSEPAAETGIHFDLDLSATHTGAGVAPLELEKTIAGAGSDFDFNAPAMTPSSGPIDLSSINLELNEPEIRIDEPLPAGGDAEEAATKLELAKAYEEMGDKEGARELLQEVMKEGDAGQQQKARDMLAALV